MDSSVRMAVVGTAEIVAESALIMETALVIGLLMSDLIRDVLLRN